MSSSNANTYLNATVINIHSPVGSPEDSQRRPSSIGQQAPAKQSPKVEEYRKMIQHIMGKILKRKRPSSSLLYLQPQSIDQFDNDDTIDLLIKLRSALMVCHSVGLSNQVLMQGGRTPNATPVSSKVNSPLPSPRIGSPSRSPENAASALPSVLQSKNDKRSEFEKILSMLSDLVANDSRYKTSNPKPSVPPFTMQSILIDIGLILIQMIDDTHSLYDVGLVFLPAFEAFSNGPMLGKLLSLYLDTLLPRLMSHDISHNTAPKETNTKPLDNDLKHKTSLTVHSKQNTPTISIQSPDPEPTSTHSLKMSHLTIDTRLQASNADINSFNSLPYGSNQGHQSPADLHHSYALFAPLLFFMMEYLDPYIEHKNEEYDSLDHTMTQQASSIYSFHRALGYMISCKPDIYLDLLDIVSHGTTSVKYRACQVLFYYYSNSIGHSLITSPISLLSIEEEIAALDKRRKEQKTEQEQNEPRLSGSYKRLQKNQQPVAQNTASPSAPDTLENEMNEVQHIWSPHIFDRVNSSIESKHTTGTALFQMHDDVNEAFCKECFKSIKGYGLRCYQCKASVHYSCFNSNSNEQGTLFYLKAGGIQKVVTPVYCTIPPSPRFTDMVNRGMAHWTMKSNSTRVGLLGHVFNLVNLYTLTTCASCSLPLWGIAQQCYHCTHCNRFVHPHCLSEAEENNAFSNTSFHTCRPGQFLAESDIHVTTSDISKSLYEFYGDALPLKVKDLQDRGFEEVATILNTLLLQDNIMHWGIATGCILISDESEDPLISQLRQEENSTSNPFSDEIPYATGSCQLLTASIRACLDYLGSEKCKKSTFLVNFQKQQDKMNEYVLSREDYLSHLSAMMKSLVTSFGDNLTAGSPTAYSHSSPPPLDPRRSIGDARGFLQVNPAPYSPWEEEADDFNSGSPPNEQLDRSVLLSWVMTNTNFKSRKAAELLLQQMRNVGLFERFDGSAIVFYADETTSANHDDTPIACIFPVPFAIDCSFTVESTLNAIEACLTDVDLSINECGLLLLVRRCWPSSFMSQYTQQRLVQAILSWTFDEDERLLALHAELTSNKASNLSKQHIRWAQTAYARKIKGQHADRHRQSVLYHSATAGVSSGASNIYVTTRAALKDRYVAYWMCSLHDMDRQAYADMLFTAIENSLDDKREYSIPLCWSEARDKKKQVVERYEQFVSHILKLKSYGLVFSSLDFLIQKWFNHAYEEFDSLGILQGEEILEIKHLAKLCSSKLKTVSSSPDSSRFGSALDILVEQFHDGSKAGISRGMRWLTLTVYAGTGVPSKALIQIAKMLTKSQASLDVFAGFVKVIWFQTVGVSSGLLARKDIIEIIGHIHENQAEMLSKLNDSDRNLLSMQSFIKHSIALVAFAFGCSLNNIAELDIVPFTSSSPISPANKRNTLHSNNVAMQPDEKSPVIQYLLTYLEFKQLDIDEYIIKLYYALSQWGHGILNKEEFLLKCMPHIMPTVWKHLLPTFDYLSDINLTLLMNLISIDAGYFQSYVHEIFKDQNWELRYQGLDNLFGLFTKMDTIFQTEWLKLLCHLGPMFSFFVQSLWDKEDKVRSKALTLIRTFNTLHLRSAFRCWEAYFLTASDEQKKALIQQMMQLNALFPDWQVLEWESLLEALERESYIVVSDDPTHTPLNYDLLKDEIQSDKEIQNLKLLLITLALQMLSNHLKPTHEQIFRLKLILVQQMGFQNCHYFNNAGEISVEFDHLRYDPNNSLQVASMICCIRSLKKVMDSFAPLPAETIALMVSQSVEHGKLNLSENTSPGIYFLDVVFKMLNSGIDLAQLGNLILRTWLETFLIVIYKHNILEPRYERDIVSSMKVVIELLNLDVGEENKLLILEILKCLLRRSDHLTAMVLSKQIMALGKILTKHGLKHSDPVLLKAKQFLKSAFLRFAVAGLFVLLFKNQPVHDDNNKKVDLFFVLRTVIDPEDIVPDEDIHGEHVYLYDQPVRDVLDKLMKQQMDRKAFSNVLYNTCRYVETVHSHPYSLSILNELPNFLNTLIKHTSDWRRSDWDINPVLSMSAILLKEHPYQYSSLLSPIQAVFKYGLHDCMIQPEAVARLLIAYSLITSVPDVPPVNPFVDIILEETKNYLLGLNRPNKEMMLMLLQVIYWDLTPSGQVWYMEISKSVFNNFNEHASYFELKLKNILPQMVHFLKLPSSSQPFTKRDFKVHSITSQLVAYSCTKDPNEMTRILGFLKLEETPECLRFLNWFILALLKSKSSQTLLSMLRYENVITDLLTQTLNSVKIDFHNPSPNFLYSRVNEVLLLCFLLTKTWALLKMKCKNLGEEQGINQVFFWLSIWPSLRRLLEAIEPSTLFIAGGAGVPIWNMFLSLLQLLFVSRSDATVVNAYEWSILLDYLLTKIEEISNDVFIGQEHDADQVVVIANFKRQVTKIRTMLDVPPAEAPLALLVDQLLMELREIMRLEVETVITHGVNRELTLPDASYAVRL